MTPDVEMLRRYLERALALAHAALDEPTPARIADAHATGQDALALVANRRPAATTLADGHVLYAHASRLRGLLAVLPSTSAVAAIAYDQFTRA
ncbi:MAG: hypothetical protein JWM53_4176 [bacterium]|nr:hypothetical protein [bacterium]